MKHTLAHNGQERVFEVKRQGDRLVVTTEDDVQHHVDLLRSEADRLVLSLDGKRLAVCGAKVGEQKHVWVSDRHLRFTPVVAGTPSASADPGALSVSIPAVVTEVLVQPHDRVSTGDKLVLLESMKMVLAVQAPHGGVVQAVHCKAGQSVEPGVALVELSDHD